MKLTFFEKNLFDQSAREKPAISTNDSQKTDLDNIKSDFTKQYKSEALEKTVRQIKIPIEYLPFYSDGEKFTGKIKKTDITSGEREIVSTVDAPGRQLPIDVEFQATARLRSQQQIEQQNPEISFNNVRERENQQFEPFIKIGIGQIERQISGGFADRTRYIESIRHGARTYKSAYYRFLNYIRGVVPGILSSDFYTDDFDRQTPEQDLPRELFSRTVEIPMVDNTIYRRQVSVKYTFLNSPILETEYWKIRNLKKIITYSYRDYSLYGQDLIIPVVQKVRLDGEPYQVTRAGVEIQDGITETVKAYAPFNLSIGNITVNREDPSIINSIRQTGTENTSVLGNIRTSSARTGRTTGDYFINRIEKIFVNVLRSASGNEWLQSIYRAKISVFFESSLFFRNYIGNNFMNIFVDLDNVNNDRATPGTPAGTLRHYGEYIYSLEKVENNKIVFIGSINVSHATDDLLSLDDFFNNSDFLNQFKTQEKINLLNNFLTNIFMNKINAVGYSPPTFDELWNSRSNPPSLFVNPTLNKVDLGIADVENSIYANGKRVSGLTFSHNNLSGRVTPFYQVSFFKLNSQPLNFRQLDLLQAGDDPEVAPDVRLKNRILPISISGASASYNIVDVDFSNNRIYIERSDRSSFSNNPDGSPRDRNTPLDQEITQITITRPGRSPLVFRVTLIRLPLASQPRANPGSQVYFESGTIAELLKYSFPDPTSSAGVKYYVNDPVRSPKIEDWLALSGLSFSNLKNRLKPLPLNFSIAITGEGQTQPEEQEAQNLIQGSVSPSFPWVTIPLLEYREGRIYIEMERHPNAPVPNKRFFDSVSIAGRKFNFSQSRYNKALGFAEYSWPTPIDFIEGKTFIPLIFRKKGTSYTDDQSYSRLVQKSTVQTIEKKEIPKLLGGFKVVDFDFDTTKFKISFSGIIPASAFQSIAVLDKNNIENITRQMRTADATRSVDDNITTFEWNNLPDFFSLHRNKEYTLEMIKGANNEVLDFFIPRPLKSGFHIVNDVKFEDDDLKLFLDIFGSEVEDSPFISVKILNPNGTDFMTSKQEKSGIKTVSGKEMDYTFKNAVTGLRALVSGDKFDLAFAVKDFPSFELNFTKMTDIFFDTLVILNTNIDDINIKNQLDNELIHPSDVQVFKSETENGLRHIVLMLNNPVTAGQIRLVNRRLFGSDKSRAIGQIYCLKKIGDFSKLPVVQPNLNQGKIATLDQYNRAHVKSFPPAINYSLTFLPLETKEDIALAQDLFLRLADYNEFIIWVSGGDIIENRQGVRGFRFVDIIKALCVNEENIVFSDGRISSGVTFTMEIAQVQ